MVIAQQNQQNQHKLYMDFQWVYLLFITHTTWYLESTDPIESVAFRLLVMKSNPHY
jgi:hypothetical protein